MFGKILVANRGEIALRVMRTCRALGIKTVAVFSDADAGAPHAEAADEVVRIGPEPPDRSYLSIERILDAARRTQAEAIHPGYGFLSERAEFAAACAAAGLVFVGPSPEAMRELGDKVAARRLAEALGVPCAPGYHGDDQELKRLRKEAERIGTPLLIKAAAGGGGRGMRRVDRLDDLPAALDAAGHEAKQAFGDGRVFLERLVEPARHVEVQILADQHGTVVALGDRDCSIQRRHQKLVEEAPAPDLSEELRAAMHAAAVRLARAAHYTNAGTVEFLVSSGRFAFLEVNARLQVEHTVTELVTGLDLVEWQFRVAAGASLDDALRVDEGRKTKDGWGGGDSSFVLRPSSGHAVQARIYAEDPARGFLPKPGVIRRVRWPAGEGLRVDAAITAAGQHVSGAYDPLLAKIVCAAPDRVTALARLDRALAETVVLGVPSTGGFLRRVLGTPEFRAGPVHTDFLAQRPGLAAQPPPPAAVLRRARIATTSGPWVRLNGWRLGRPRRVPRVRVDATWRPMPEGTGARADAAVVALPLQGEEGAEGYEVIAGGERWVVWLDTPAAPPVDPARISSAEGADGEPVLKAEVSAAGNWFLSAPLSGKLAAPAAREGAVVAAGAAVAAVEAMKMQHALVAPRAARVVRWLVEPGAFVRGGQPMVELAPAADAGDVEPGPVPATAASQRGTSPRATGAQESS